MAESEWEQFTLNSAQPLLELYIISSSVIWV
jgi:hypothetical protein